MIVCFDSAEFPDCMLEQALGPKFILYPGLAGAIVLVRNVLRLSPNGRFLLLNLLRFRAVAFPLYSSLLPINDISAIYTYI